VVREEIDGEREKFRTTERKITMFKQMVSIVPNRSKRAESMKMK
jgi:hypothetical protein